LSKLGRGLPLKLVKQGDLKALQQKILFELSTIRIKVVFDDYQLCRDFKLSDFIRKILELGDCIVISRARPVELLAQNVTEIELKGFTQKETRAFIRSRLGKSAKESTLGKRGKRSKTTRLRLSYLCQTLLNGKKLPESLSDITEYTASQISRALSRDELSVVSALSVYREAVPIHAIRWIIPSRIALRAVLRSLETKGVVKKRGELFGIHSLIREAIHTKSAELQQRAAAYYLRVGDSRSALEVLYHYAEAGDFSEVAKTLKSYYRRALDQGFAKPLGDLVDELLKQPLSKEAEMWCFYVKATIMSHSASGMSESLELLKHVEEIAVELRDYEMIARSKQLTGYVLIEKGEIAKATLLLEHAYQEAQQKRLPISRQAGLLSVLAQALMRGRALKKLLLLQKRILELYSQAGDKVNVFNTR